MFPELARDVVLVLAGFGIIAYGTVARRRRGRSEVSAEAWGERLIGVMLLALGVGLWADMEWMTWASVLAGVIGVGLLIAARLRQTWHEARP